MAPRPPPAELMDELVEEILLRIPPDDPTRLLRAALVCKRWCRIVSAAGFRLRFRNGNGNGGTFAHVYSSEAAAWSKRISAQHLHEDIRSLPSALAGNALYFVCSTIILKYDLAAREMSVIHLPGECFFRPIVVRTTEDGGLGLASIRSHRLYLHEWSIEDAGWVQSKVIKLTKLLPDETLGSLRLTGFAHGLDIILVVASERTFTIDLKSLEVTKVCEEGWCYGIFPYMSFCNPGSRHWERLPLPSDQEQAPQMSDEHDILH